MTPRNHRILLEFQNLNITHRKSGRQILRDVSGKALPGRLLAIMGESGAGKSTLLDVLTAKIGAQKGLLADGEILFNGTGRRSADFFKRHVAYVPQEELLFSTLTIKETFELSAQLRSSNKPQKQIDSHVEKMLDLLELTHCADTLVGGKLIKSISGGERKRVSIGTKLINDPSIFIVDEPTSGLDSFTASKVISLLQKLAQSGKTVVATIHSPSSKVYHMFDDLLLLHRGGVVYHGEAQEALRFFETCGHQFPEYSNPADFLMKTLDSLSAEEVAEISAQWRQDSHFYPKSATETEVHDSLERPTFIQRCAKSFQHTSLLLRKRALRNYLRNPSTTKLRAVSLLLFALLCGLLLLQVGDSFREQIAKRNAMFFMMFNVNFNTVFSVILNFYNERPVALNQIRDGLYPPCSYILSKLAIEIPMQVVFVLLYLPVVYFMVGFGGSASQFFSLLGVLIFCAEIAYAVSLFIGIAVRSPQIALYASLVFFIPSVLFSGFFVDPRALGSWAKRLSYGNYFRYIIDLMAFVEFADGTPEGLRALDYFGLADLNFVLWSAVLAGVFAGSLLAVVVSIHLVSLD